MREEIARTHRSVARIAARQHGVVAYGQLVSAGLTRSTISRRVRGGWLHRIHQGVYAVGHDNLTREGQWMAAVLACGEGAALSHQSAAALWGISPTSPSFVHVTVPNYNGRRKRRRIKIHYTVTLTAAETTLRRNIPVTTHARTLRDLGFGPETTHSHLERLFLRLCARNGIPKPEVNVPIGPYKVDFLWREARLIAETDGYAFHSGRRAFEADRARDRELKLRGYEVLRFTYREVTEQPHTVVASVRAHLHQRSRAAG